MVTSRAGHLFDRMQLKPFDREKIACFSALVALMDLTEIPSSGSHVMVPCVSNVGCTIMAHAPAVSNGYRYDRCTGPLIMTACVMTAWMNWKVHTMTDSRPEYTADQIVMLKALRAKALAGHPVYDGNAAPRVNSKRGKRAKRNSKKNS